MPVYRYLNKLLRHKTNYEQMINYLKTGEKPKSRNITEEVLKEFELQGADLVHKPTGLTGVHPDDVESVIKQEYQDLSRSAGMGPPSLYRKIRDTYLGISRDRVRQFLVGQP
eukprot:44351-Eustigmatos_ZCMA.PRE.1